MTDKLSHNVSMAGLPGYFVCKCNPSCATSSIELSVASVDPLYSLTLFNFAVSLEPLSVHHANDGFIITEKLDKCIE